MRTLVKVSIPVERGNAAIADGSLPQTMQDLMAAIEPEAAYFTVEDGRRMVYLVFDLHEPADMPRLFEPLFIGLEAGISMAPCMNADDLQRGLQAVTIPQARSASGSETKSPAGSPS
jgi:hypothetical protein